MVKWLIIRESMKPIQEKTLNLSILTSVDQSIK